MHRCVRALNHDVERHRSFHPDRCELTWTRGLGLLVQGVAYHPDGSLLTQNANREDTCTLLFRPLDCLMPHDSTHQHLSVHICLHGHAGESLLSRERELPAELGLGFSMTPAAAAAPPSASYGAAQSNARCAPPPAGDVVEGEAQLRACTDGTTQAALAWTFLVDGAGARRTGTLAVSANRRALTVQLHAVSAMDDIDDDSEEEEADAGGIQVSVVYRLMRVDRRFDEQSRPW